MGKPALRAANILRLTVAFGLAALAGGCATAPSNPRDPLEPYNRAMYKFNDTLDRALLKPVAQGYDKVLPDLVKAGVRNFFNNLGSLVVIANDILQGKGNQAADDWARFFLNTTIGLGGLFDIATPVGLERHEEDFGQTMGRWGAGSGAYVVLPFFGPSSVRDGLGLLADFPLKYPAHVDYVPARNTAYAIDVISVRADLLRASNILEEAAFDPYAFVRDAYLQRRRNLVYDGKPPPEEEEEEEPTSDHNAARPAAQPAEIGKEKQESKE